MPDDNEQKKICRCAVYTRKSTDEGLEQEFNTLDAQREAAEAYISSQRHEGWICLSEHYDDGGYSGGNVNRPGLKRLLADIDAGRIDCVVVYKVDRLSRSLLDFTKMMDTFDKKNVSFVSVTQQFNTTSSMGRLTLNILLSFAQFEREISSERIRDKIQASKRKGKWMGGPPPVGYDIAPEGKRLIVNEAEAMIVREIFQMYIENSAVLPIMRDLARRGIRNKRRITKGGVERGGSAFTKNRIYDVLNNHLYVGEVMANGEAFPGEHEAIVSREMWDKAQALLHRDDRKFSCRNKYNALLRGLLFCGSCGTPMDHVCSPKDNGKCYYYYVCRNAKQKGWNECGTKSIGAHAIEQAVLEQIRVLGNNPEMLAAIVQRMNAEKDKKTEAINTELTSLKGDLKRYRGRLSALIGHHSTVDTKTMDECAQAINSLEPRIAELKKTLTQLGGIGLNEANICADMKRFDEVWDALQTNEKVYLLRLLIEKIVYNGETDTVKIMFHTDGFRAIGRTRQIAEGV